MIKTQYGEGQPPRGNNSRPTQRKRPFRSKPRLLSDGKSSKVANRIEKCYPQAVQRLSLAIINHAVLDLLEEGRHSRSAERWLLSREFDSLHELLG